MQESCGQLYEPPLHFEDSAAQQLLVVVTLDDPILHKTVELTAADNTLFVIAGGKIHLPGRTPCSLTVLTSRLESTMKHLHALMAKSLDDILGLGPDNLNFPGLPRIVIDAYVPEADGVLRDFHISVPRIVDAESFDSDLGKLLNNLESISGRFLRPVKAALDDVISGPAVVIETNEPDGRREVLGLASKVLWHGAHGQREMLANGDQLPDEIKPYDTDRVNIYSNEDFGNDEFSAVEAKLAAVDWEELASEEPCPPDATRHVFYVRGGDVVTQEYEWQSFVVCDSVSQTENPALRALVDSMLEMRDSSSQKNFYLVDTSKSSHPNSNVHRSWTLNAPPQAPTFDYLQMANGSEALGLQLWLRSELPHNNISDLLYLEAPSAQDPQGTVGNQGILVISDPPCVLSLTSDDIAAINALVSSIDLDETGNSNQECASDKWRHSWRFAGVKLHQVDDAQSCESAPTGLLPLLQDLADRAHTKCGSPALRSLIIEVPDFVTTSATVIPSDAQLFPGFSMHQDKEIVLDHCTVQPQKESLEILKQALDTYLLHVTAGGPLTPWCAHLPWFQFYADVLVSNAQQPSGFSVAFTACGFDTGQRLPIGLIDLFDVLQRYKMGLEPIYNWSMPVLIQPSSEGDGKGTADESPLDAPGFFVKTSGGMLNLTIIHAYSNGKLWRVTNTPGQSGVPVWKVFGDCRQQLSPEDKASLEAAILAVDWANIRDVETVMPDAMQAEFQLWLPGGEGKVELGKKLYGVESELEEFNQELARIGIKYCQGWTQY